MSGVAYGTLWAAIPVTCRDTHISRNVHCDYRGRIQHVEGDWPQFDVAVRLYNVRAASLSSWIGLRFLLVLVGSGLTVFAWEKDP